MRGRRLAYDPRDGLRPMKHRIREAIFNLVGPSIRGTHAIDLFAGSGVLGLEAISRGARSATLIERHIGTARRIVENARLLGIEDRTDVVTASALTWSPPAAALPEERPWVVFCSPPYDLYVERTDHLLALIGRLIASCPRDSSVVVEADRRFDFRLLPRPEQWDVRIYRPAHVGILRTGSGDPAAP